MFAKFRVQNFMCLKNVCVELEPLTIFIGPNSSGKSAFFKALKTFHTLFRYPVRGGKFGEFQVEPGVTFDQAVWNCDSSLPVTFEVWLWGKTGSDPDYTIELQRDYTGWNITREKFQINGKWFDSGQRPFKFKTSRGPKQWDGPYKAPIPYLTYRYLSDPVAAEQVKPLQDLKEQFGIARRYRPTASEIASPLSQDRLSGGKRGEDESDPEPNDTGRGLVLALQHLLLTQRDIFSELEKELSQLHNHITGINFKPDWRGIGLLYKTNRVATGEIQAIQESDGVLLSTFLLWRLYSATTGLKICLEEPENGTHLSMLKDRYEILKQFATEESGASRPRPQILVAIHSRDFLNAIESRRDIIRQIRVVEFDQDNGSTIHKLDHWREINHLLEEVNDRMGDLWWSDRLQGRARTGSSG